MVVANSSEMRVLVTGAGGFIGRSLVESLLEAGYLVRAAGRNAPSYKNCAIEDAELGDLREHEPDWRTLLKDVGAVVHLAAMVHRMDPGADTDERGYDKVNHKATRSLAEEIARTPTVRRFVFLSSVAVHGIGCSLPVSAASALSPTSPYARSKLNAERAIEEILNPGSLYWAIYRPVLVYGRDNPGNMERLAALIRRGVPIPVTRPPNRRSFLFVENLVAGIVEYLHARNPPSGVKWIIADHEVVSTQELVQSIARAMRIQARVIPVPAAVLKVAARVGDLLRLHGVAATWNEDVRRKLVDDFFVDATLIERELGFVPPYSIREGIARTFECRGSASGHSEP